MGFKFIYKKKIHKLPLFVSNIKNIRESIIQIYPQIDQTFRLFYIHQGEPLEIISEDALVILLRILRLSTIKLLVHEGNVDTVEIDDINYMQQSFIDRSQIDLRESQSQNQVQQQKLPNPFYQQDQYNPFNNQQNAQQVQNQNTFKPSYPQFNQEQLKQSNSQWNPFIYSPLNANQQAAQKQQTLVPQQPSIQAPQPQPQPPLFWKKVEEGPQCKPYHYKAMLVANYQCVSFQKQEFQWLFTLKNICEKTWPQTMRISCLEGIYCGQEFPIKEVIPNQQKEFIIKLRAPDTIGFYNSKWQLVYTENLRHTNLFVIDMLLEVVEEQIAPKYIDSQFLQKAKLIREVIQEYSLNYICKFIQDNNLLTQSLDNIINMLQDQKEKPLKCHGN
ncbi:hypothetical protein pb186bvf_016549 [Paramecium bursaria]